MAMERRDVMPQEMADHFEVSLNTIYRWMRDDPRVNWERLEQIAAFLRYPINWFIGMGPAEEGDGEGGDSAVMERRAEPVTAYPLLSGVGAGAGREQQREAEIHLPDVLIRSWTAGRLLGSEEAYVTRVVGDSMEPWLSEGTYLMIERTERVLDGGRYIIWIDDEDVEMVKRLERVGGGVLRVISDNPLHSTRELKSEGKNLYTDLDTGRTVALEVRGRVLYPRDTKAAFLTVLDRQHQRQQADLLTTLLRITGRVQETEQA